MNARAAVLLLATFAGTAGAQQKTTANSGSPIVDMIESAKNALNNLNYTQARTTIREVLGLTRLKREQRIAALEVAAAAYFPDDRAQRMPDSTTYFLRRLARLMPIGSLPPDLNSPALDSQLVLARTTTFGATLRSPLELTLQGAELRPAIDVNSTQLARWQLYVLSGEGGPPVLVDTLGAATTGKLSLRAHDGTHAIIQPGNVQFRVLSIATAAPDTISLRLDGTATGAPPTLVDLPVGLDSSKLLPERAGRAITAGVIGGLVVGAATWALANSAKPPHALGKEPHDSRSTVVGVSIAAGAVAGGFLDRGKPLPANIRANAALRTSYLKEVGDAIEQNRGRIAKSKLAITIDPEIK